MLRSDRICVGILIFGFIFLIPSVFYIKFIDELCSFFWGALIALDCVVNNNWRRYKLLAIILSVFVFYAIYSIFYLKFNTTPYILMDFVIQLKSFLPFVAFLAIGPIFTEKDKKIIRITALVNSSVIAASFLGGYDLVNLIVSHPAYSGIILMVSMLMYAFCSLDKEGRLSSKDFKIVVIFLTIGLACTRSKYYGEYILFLFFMYLYKPGMLRNSKSAIIALTCLLVILGVSWSKIDYYFLSGGTDTVDVTQLQTFARPVLYATSALILMDYFPFGSGLASFATHASAANYSNLYYEYGIDKVYGLSPQMGEFICDAYYPSLAQFGFFGIALFIAFWVYAYGFLRKGIRQDPAHNRYPFIIGSMIIAFILIESIAGSAFTLSCGIILMGLLGKICHDMQAQSPKKQSILTKQPLTETIRSIKKI